jgi:hypothetical protein
MKNERIRLLLARVTACISLMFFITPTQGANIVIWGNTTDIGTIIIVSPKPGDSPTTAGTALLNTINGITDNSATNPYLIKLAPGIYDIGTARLLMKEYVDLEGSGPNVTVITGTVSNGSFPPTSGVVNGASNAEIRFLTVENTGSGTYSVALLNNSASPAVTNVTATASGSSNVVTYAVFNYSSSPTITNVTANASGTTGTIYGVVNNSSSPVMNNVTVTVSGGTGTAVFGISSAFSSSPIMNNVTIEVSGGTSVFGVSSGALSSSTMNNVTVTVSGGTGATTRGVNNDSSSSTLNNVTATASGGANNYGLYVLSGTVLADRSTFDGSTNSIYNQGTVHIGVSKLVSAPAGGIGTWNCVGVYKYMGGTLSSADGSCN